MLKLKFPRSSKAKAISLALEPYIGVTSLVVFSEESEKPLKKVSKRIKWRFAFDIFAKYDEVKTKERFNESSESRKTYKSCQLAQDRYQEIGLAWHPLLLKSDYLPPPQVQGKISQIPKGKVMICDGYNQYWYNFVVIWNLYFLLKISSCPFYNRHYIICHKRILIKQRFQPYNKGKIKMNIED